MSSAPLFRNPFQGKNRARERFSNLIADLPSFPQPEKGAEPIPLLQRQITFSEEVHIPEKKEEEMEEDLYSVIEGLRPEFDDEWFLEGEEFGKDSFQTHQPSPPQDTLEWDIVMENFKDSGLSEFDYEVSDREEVEDSAQERKRRYIRKMLGIE